MIKNNFTMPATYVSPAVKVTQLKARRVMCTSPEFGELNEAGAIISEDGNDIYNY